MHSIFERKAKTTAYLQNLHTALGNMFLEEILKHKKLSVWYLLYKKRFLDTGIARFFSSFPAFNEAQTVYNFLKLDILEEEWILYPIMEKVSQKRNRNFLETTKKELEKNFSKYLVFLYLLEIAERGNLKTFASKYMDRLYEINISTEKGLKYVLYNRWNEIKIEIANFFLARIKESVSDIKEFDEKFDPMDIQRFFNKVRKDWVEEYLFLPSRVLSEFITYVIPEIPKQFKLIPRTSNLYLDFLYQVAPYGDINEYLLITEPFWKKRDLYIFQLP